MLGFLVKGNPYRRLWSWVPKGINKQWRWRVFEKPSLRLVWFVLFILLGCTKWFQIRSCLKVYSNTSLRNQLHLLPILLYPFSFFVIMKATKINVANNNLSYNGITVYSVFNPSPDFKTLMALTSGFSSKIAFRDFRTETGTL